MTRMLQVEHGWFAWYPVRTCDDRKWYWLRRVNRFRYINLLSPVATPWAYVVPEPDAGNGHDNPAFRTFPTDEQDD